MLWTCKEYTVYPEKFVGGFLIHMGEPDHVEWYRCGKEATREEVLASIEAGFPALATVAMGDTKNADAMTYLTKQRDKFESQFVPHA